MPCRLSLTCATSFAMLFLESIFQDPCPTLNGTRRATMPQVLTRRREPIALLAKRGHLYLQTQKLALVAITHEAEAHSLTARSHSHLTRTGYNCMLSNCTHCLVSHLTRTGYSCMLNNRTHRLV